MLDPFQHTYGKRMGGLLFIPALMGEIDHWGHLYPGMLPRLTTQKAQVILPRVLRLFNPILLSSITELAYLLIAIT